LDSAVAIDNCSGVTLTAQLDTLEGQEGIGWDLQVTWSAIDGCGNANSVIQVIEVLDGLAPAILSGPADTILSWGEPFLIEEWQSEILAEDGCTSVGNLIYSHEVDTLETTEPCVDIVSITWSVTDLAGNHSEVEQMVQLNDNDAPEVTEWPLNLALTCDEVWVPVLPEALDDNLFLVGAARHLGRRMSLGHCHPAHFAGDRCLWQCNHLMGSVHLLRRQCCPSGDLMAARPLAPRC
jgi:hypothetical protein